MMLIYLKLKKYNFFRMAPFKVKTCDDPMPCSGSNY